jgi:hypothetical protein
MRFLRNSDYRLIAPDELDVLLTQAVGSSGYDKTQILIDFENGAIEEISSYIMARYDVARIFSDTPVWDSTKTYSGQNRVQYHESAWDSATTYSANARVSYLGSIYNSTAGANTNHLPTDITKWTFVCLDYALFYVSIPYPEFQEFSNYPKGSQVWFKDNYTYLALQDTQGAKLGDAYFSTYGADTTTTDLQNSLYSAPAQDITNKYVWSKSTLPYTVTAGTLPTDGTKWTAGDNRSQLLLEHIVDIVLFKLCATVVPRSIPEIRILRYNGNDVNSNGGAIGWCKKIAGGDIEASLYNVYKQQGLATVYGSSSPKQVNTY